MYLRPFLLSAILDFQLVRLHEAIRDITKHFPLHNFDKIHQTASKSKFKDWPKNKKNNLASMFSFFIFKTKLRTLKTDLTNQLDQFFLNSS